MYSIFELRAMREYIEHFLEFILLIEDSRETSSCPGQ